jgi:hypothetical protein
MPGAFERLALRRTPADTARHLPHSNRAIAKTNHQQRRKRSSDMTINFNSQKFIELQEEKIASVKDEFHELNDLEIQPGYRVNDLVSRAECDRARVLLKTEIDNIVRQIEVARLEHAKGRKMINNEWVLRAQNAIRWKRRVMKAVAAKSKQLPLSTRPRAETFRTCLLRVISADLGEERMAEYAEKARELFPQFARSEEGGEA